MSLREMYEYLYCKIYKSLTISAMSRDWGIVEWRANGLLLTQEFLFCLSLFMLYLMFIDSRSVVPESSIMTVVIIIICAIELKIYFIFHSKDQWKDIVNKYDAWPRKKNNIGTIIVLAFVLAVLAFVLFSIITFCYGDWRMDRLKP